MYLKRTNGVNYKLIYADWLSMFYSSDVNCPIISQLLLKNVSNVYSNWSNTDVISFDFNFDITVNPKNAFSEFPVLKVMTKDGTPYLMPINVTVWEEKIVIPVVTQINMAPFLLSPPLSITEIVDSAAPILEYTFRLSEAYDDNNLMDTLSISSQTLGSLAYKYKSGIAVLDTSNSKYLSYDVSTTALKVTFESFNKLNES